MTGDRRRWRRTTAGGAGWLVVALCAGPAAPAPVEGFRVTRTVEVDRPGLIRVGLDLDDLREMLPAAGDLRVYSPTGVELPHRHHFESPAGRRVPARLQGVERTATGWSIRLDAGGGKTPHRSLVFEMAQTVLAPGVRLESSADGQSWRLLAESDLFRVGKEDGMRQATLGYEPTADRFLRLHWPGDAGFPEAERISLELLAASPIEQHVEAPECRAPAPGEIACRLRSEADLARRLSLEVAATGAVAYRLSIAESATWLPLAEGAWHLGPAAARVRVVPTPRLERSAEMRLELYGDPASPPELAAYTLEYPSQTVYFRAERAGSYTLAFGGDRRPTGSALETTAAERQGATPVEPGATELHPPPALPAAAVEARTPLPEAPFSRGWEVRAPGAEGGTVVHLRLPPAVLRATRRGLPDLRLAVDDRQLPFLVWRWEAPQAVLAGAGARPRPGSVEGASLFELRLPDSAAALSQLELTTGEGPFGRRLRVRLPAERRRELGATKRPSPRRRWSCPPPQPLPCRLGWPMGGLDGHGRLEVEIEDVDNPPLDELRIDLWGAAPGLVFVWPQRGSVRLLAGNPDLAAPDYDLELMRELLSRRPWLEATLDLESAAADRARTDRRGRLMMMAALAVAAVFLLVLLVRILRQS